MTHSLALTPEELAEVRRILALHLAPGTKVWVFGSRTTGMHKPWSDLDLVLDGNGPQPLAVMAALAEAFAESALPWKVDLVDRATVSPAFGAIIDDSRIPLPLPDA